MPEVNLEEIKGLLATQMQAFEAYKSANDLQMAELKKKGSADVITVEQVKKIDDALNDLSEKQQQANTKLLLVEKQAARPYPGAKREDDPVEKKRVSDFLQTCRKGAGGNSQVQFEAMQTKDGEVVVDPAGGYYVPPTFVNRIVERVFETTAMRPLCTTMTTEGDDIEFINNTVDIGGGWVGETQSRTTTAATSPGKIRIPTNELYAKPELTQKLLDDNGFNLESYLVSKISDKLARLENAAFITGSGAGQPNGITTYATTSADDSSRPWGTMQYVPVGFTNVSAWIAGTNPGDILYTLIYKLKTELLNGSSWLIPRPVLTGIRQLKNAVGGYLWQPSLQLGQPNTLLDYPVTIAPDMPAVASNSLSAAFGNFKEGYTILDRIGIRMLRDPFTNKPFVQFYTTKRTGGGVVNSEAIKFLKFSAS